MAARLDVLVDGCSVLNWRIDANNTVNSVADASARQIIMIAMQAEQIPGNGCEIHDGDVCTGAGGLQGNWSGCSCVVAPQHHLTGTPATYSSTDPNLWSVQYGTGSLLNLTSMAYNATLSVNGSG